MAAPYEEIPRLDLAAVAAAEGHHAEAQRIIRDEICNRTDDEATHRQNSQPAPSRSCERYARLDRHQSQLTTAGRCRQAQRPACAQG
jgi:hypothetical protein